MSLMRILNVNPAITLSTDLLNDFCQRWQIVEFALFGSILRDDFHSGSDIDILVTFAANSPWGLLEHAQMQQELETKLGRNVDLITKKSIENSSNWIRRQEILSTAQIIYAQ